MPDTNPPKSAPPSKRFIYRIEVMAGIGSILIGGICLLTLILPIPIAFDTDVTVPGTGKTIHHIYVLGVDPFCAVLAGTLLIGGGIAAIRLSKKK